jgi:fucose 4-O-acetylase-like acetyltransferase
MGKETSAHFIRKISNMEQSVTKRIGYIDALRGFAMILVVYFHISAYGFGSYETGYNGIIERFRMPIFFFISGWLFYKADRIWNWESIVDLLKKKWMQLIIPTAIFMILYLIIFGYWDFSSLGSDKKGYWFTFVLFEIIAIYVILEAFLNKRDTTKGEIMVMIIILLLSVSAFYYAKYYTRYSEELGNRKTILGLFSFVKIRHIVFFWFGTIVRKRFDKFVQITDNLYLIAALAILFIALCVFPCIFSTKGIEYVAYLLAGLAGIIIIFTIFKKVSHFAFLQYIGRHTLDIYLIHYFFLPYHIEFVATRFNLYDNYLLCMFISLFFTSIVIGTSLLTSRIIRFSPFLAKYLLAAKN